MSKDDDIVDVEFTEYLVEEINPGNLPSTIIEDDGTISQVDAEFEYARANLVNILQTSNKVLINTAELVTETDHPRMVTVYSDLIKTLADVNQSLLSLREKKMKIKGELADESRAVKPSEQTNITNNNTIFVGSTEELLKSIKG